MLRSLGNILGSVVNATDGEIRKVHDFFFDDHSWTVRYLVVETGEWLRRRRVLISTSALGKPEWQGHLFPVELTQEQVRSSPDIDTDKPVSRQHEIATNVHYGWPHYWGLEPPPLGPLVVEAVADMTQPAEAAGDPHLRSLREVSSYSLRNEGSQIGLLDDFVVEDEKWVGGISWADKEVRTSHTQADLGNSPEFDPATAVNREYEVRLYDYYGRPRYWE